ncbi:hypothetical protein BGZ73_006778, partial [Actinomortierella ambigua]
MIKAVYSISAAITLASNAFLLSLLFTPEPSAAHLWPKPLYHCHGEQTLRLSSDFVFDLPTNVHPRLAESASRYRRRILKSTFVSPIPPTVFSSPSSSVLSHSSAIHSSAFDLNRIVVQVEDPLAKAPLGPDTDESYRLLIAVDEGELDRPFDIAESHCAAIRSGVILPGLQAYIRAKTIYGAMRAFETFAQLVVNTDAPSPPRGDGDNDDNDQEAFETPTQSNTKTIPNIPIVIHDRPLFQHRGILLDTSRNFLTMATLKRTLDAMAMNKMNVFHWHLIDSHSFPLQLDDAIVPTTNTANLSSDPSNHGDEDNTQPTNNNAAAAQDDENFLPLSHLASKGAYSPSMTYSKHDVSELVAFAQARGIRVIPEIDMPGHAWCWSAAFPEITTCLNGPIQYAAQHPTGQLDPVNPKTYRVLQGVYDQVAPLFPDVWLHGGSDEVNFLCWNASNVVTDYLRAHGRHADTAGFDWVLNTFITRQHEM